MKWLDLPFSIVFAGHKVDVERIGQYPKGLHVHAICAHGFDAEFDTPHPILSLDSLSGKGRASAISKRLHLVDIGRCNGLVGCFNDLRCARDKSDAEER